MAGRKRQPIRHGTFAGAGALRRRNEPLCRECKEAERAHKREYRRKIATGEHTPSRPRPAECGTRAGYSRHYRKGEKACKRCRQAYAEAMREYRRTFPDVVERNRQWTREYGKRPEVRKRRGARLMEAQRTPGSPEYYRKRAYTLRRSAERRGASVSHGVTRAGLAGKLVVWGGRCWICRSALDDTTLTWDHVKPVSKGGVDILANLRPCCRSCNSRKGNKWPLAEGIK